jgi:hypothetical protein
MLLDHRTSPLDVSESQKPMPADRSTSFRNAASVRRLASAGPLACGALSKASSASKKYLNMALIILKKIRLF